MLACSPSVGRRNSVQIVCVSLLRTEAADQGSDLEDEWSPESLGPPSSAPQDSYSSDNSASSAAAALYMAVRNMTLSAKLLVGESNFQDRIKVLYPMVNEAESPLPRSWSPKDKFNFIGLSQNNLRVHYKGMF